VSFEQLMVRPVFSRTGSIEPVECDSVIKDARGRSAAKTDGLPEPSAPPSPEEQQVAGADRQKAWR
jgi:hypothetical protein